MERQYIAFISYRHAPLDSYVAKKLHTLIEQFAIPKALRKDGKRKLGLVFRDQEELPVSSDLSEDIRRALDHSEYLIVVCSPDTAQSPWVGREIEYFLAHHPRQRVFAVLAAGEPGDVFPYALTHGENGMEEVEPLALDARGKNLAAMDRKLRKEAVRLYAAMLGCPYDELARRQQRRRRRTAILAASAVLAVSVGFSGMLLVKNHQIDLKNQELEFKNDELARQKAEVQLRESELLTQNAREAMAAGDYAAAIGYAVSALPGEEERPYYAPAENVLMDGLNLFGTRQDDHLITDTTLTQMTAIRDFQISEDGKKLITWDDYGTLTCFDTQTGEILWINQIPAANFTSVFDHDWKLLPIPEQNSVAAYFAGTLASVSMENGRILWSNRMSLEDDHLFLAPDGKSMMCLARELDITTRTVSYELNLLSCKTGTEIHRISLPEELQGSYLTGTGNGAFSEDGKFFAGSVLETSEKYILHYYIADLTDGTVKILRSEELTEFWYDETLESVAFSGKDLLVVRKNPTGALGACLEVIDTTTGVVSLRYIPEGEAKNGDFSSGDPIQAIHTATKTYLYRGKLLYAIDRSTGLALWSYRFEDKVRDLRIVQDSFLCYTLANGSHALAWRTDLGLYNSGVFGVVADLGTAQTAKLWQDGFLRAKVTGSKIEDITMAGAENRGFAAVLTKDGQTILVKRSKLLPNLTEQRIAAAAQSKESLYDPAAALRGDALVVGPFNAYDYGAGTESHRLGVYDRQTLEHRFDIPLSGLLKQDQIFPLPHGAGYLLDDGNGNISRFDPNGTETVLSERETVILSQSENVTLQADVFESATVCLEEHHTLLTVRCGNGALQFWKNGDMGETVPLPEGMIWGLHNGVQFNRILELGENGIVVLSVFENEEDLKSDWFAVYDTHNDCWTFLEDSGSGDFDRICAVGQKKPVFAVADPDGSVWVYTDLDGEIRKTAISLQLPLTSVEQMSFAASDRVLMVKTSGKQLLFYDISTGEILLQHQLDTSNLTLVSAFEDVSNNRLYVADLSGNLASENGLCIDTTTWTVLAAIKGMLCFDEESGTLYRYDNGNLIAAKIPGTDDLIRIARDLLK